ncbi:hypothetical protein [Patiriisocius marinus]|uniref:Uncharacterized protein n=1 Tax=Patiriisocius marinus TaxID=1397112 RepID=A0A5J4ILP5_9FLAO|nr:hypothetical protein [Patiriisocius marinus]GER57915.1 hypothetical protein ULMA_00230 [Patiriisocius marinus]
MNSFKYIFVLLLFIGCKEVTTNNVSIENKPTEEVKDDVVNSANLKLLQGSWQNTLDTLSVIKIKGDVISNYYSGISAGPGVRIELSDRCLANPDPSRASEPDRYISVKGKFPDCYYINKIDKNNLMLNFLNGGIDLTFKKI